MADLVQKVEGLAGLALLGGVAFAALKFGPGIIKSFREAIEGVKQAGGAVGSVGDYVGGLYPNPVKSVPDAITIINTPGATPADIASAGSKAAWDTVGLLVPWLRPVTGAMGGVTDSVIDVVGGGVTDNKGEVKAAVADAARQAAFSSATSATAKVAAQTSTPAKAAAQTSSGTPADAIKDFFNAGKQYEGQTQVSPGVYVAPSGAIQIVKQGQIVAGGSAGAVQGIIEMQKRATGEGLYPGTNYKYDVVASYITKANAGDASALAWLKRFAPGAV